MSNRNNFIGTLFDLFHIGKDNNQVSIRTNNGIIEATDVNKDYKPLTLQGNSFNSADQLVKMDGNGKLPALDASQLININLSIDDLTDVDAPTPNVDEALVWNGSHYVSKSINTISSGSGTAAYLDNATSADGYKSITLIPNTSTPQQTMSVTAYNETVFMGGFKYPTPQYRNSWDAGIWNFNIYAYVSNNMGFAELISGIYAAKSPGGTVTITGSGTNRTATINGASPILNSDYNSDQILTSYIQTSGGTFQIIGYTSSTQVSIQTPSGYTNENSVSYTLHRYKFQISTGNITQLSSPALYNVVTAQPSYSLDLTDTIATRIYARTTNLLNTTVYLTYNGSQNFTYAITPLHQRHDDLAGLNMENTNYHHLTSTEYNFVDNIISDQGTALNCNFETSTSNILENGAVSVGTSDTVARANHVHPSDTSKLSTSLSSGKIFVGNSSNVATEVNMSGEATINNSGVVTISSTKFNNRGFVGTYVEAYNGSSQSIPNGSVITKVIFPNETQDALGEFSSNRFTSASLQKVQIYAEMYWQTFSNTSKTIIIYVYKNGAEIHRRVMSSSNNVGISSVISVPVYISLGDYLEVYVSQNDTGSKTISGQKLRIVQLY